MLLKHARLPFRHFGASRHRETILSLNLRMAETTDLPEITSNDSDPHAQQTERILSAVDKHVDRMLANDGAEIRRVFRIRELSFPIKVGNQDLNIRLSVQRVIKYFSKPENRKLLISLSQDDKEIAAHLRKKIEEALLSDVETYQQFRRTKLPIFSFESHFKILELDFVGPGQAIREALKHIAFMNKVRTQTKKSGSLPPHKRVFFAATEMMLRASRRVTRFFEEDDETDSQTKENALKGFLYLVEQFWAHQVSRPKYNKGLRGEDDYWSFPNKGDAEMRKSGFYPISVRTSPDTHRYRTTQEAVAATVWATLRQQVQGREKMLQQGKSLRQLPRRRKEGYWVVVETDPKSDALFQKIHIPYDVLLGDEADFQSFYRHFLKQLHDQKVTVTGPQSYEETTQLAEEEVYYDSSTHKYNRAQSDNFADADLRVVVDELSSDSTKIPHYFRKPKYNPCGTRTPTVAVISVAPEAISKGEVIVGSFTTLNAHAPIDGKEADAETRAIAADLETTRADIASDETYIAHHADERSIEELETALTHHKAQREIPVLSDAFDEPVTTETAELSGITAYEARLGTDIVQQRDVIIQMLIDLFDKDSQLNEHFSKNYDGAVIDIYNVFSWAVCLTLGLEDVHFLEADGNGLTPVGLALPLALEKLDQEIDVDSDPEKLKAALLQNPDLIYILTETAKEFQEQRSTAKRHITKEGKIRIGMAPIEVLKVASGPFRDVLSKLARITLPYANNLATNSFLISAMAGSKRKQMEVGKNQTRAFATASDTIYSEYGGIGLKDFADGAWRVVIRAGKTDVVRRQFEKTDFYFSEIVQAAVKKFCEQQGIPVPDTFPLPEKVLSFLFGYVLRQKIYFVMGVFTAQIEIDNRRQKQKISQAVP